LLEIYRGLVYNLPMRSKRIAVVFFCVVLLPFLGSACSTMTNSEQSGKAVYPAVPSHAATLTPAAIPPSQTSEPSSQMPTPNPAVTRPPQSWIFPDAEIVNSLTSVGFDIEGYIESTSGFLADYEQFTISNGWIRGADLVEMVAIENSINPKLLLALIEYQSGYVFGNPEDPELALPALGNREYYRQDLYGQLDWAVNRLSEGFYGWLNGTVREIEFQDGQVIVPPEEINAGSFALMFFFAGFHSGAEWENDLDPELGLPALYVDMFGNPWNNPTAVLPLVLSDLSQPALSLPFEVGVTWALTGGPHPAFEGNGPLAALDFVPPMAKAGCYQTGEWVTAVADGLVVRSELGQVVQDLDGDGLEGTGWAILYLHIGDKDRVPVGTYLKQGEFLGHPSCEGGKAFGTHLHLARKYNGVWMDAAGDVPFVLDGWRAISGEAPYKGGLVKGEETVTADQFGALCSLLYRDCEPYSSIISKISR